MFYHRSYLLNPIEEQDSYPPIAAMGKNNVIHRLKKTSISPPNLFQSCFTPFSTAFINPTTCFTRFILVPQFIPVTRCYGDKCKAIIKPPSQRKSFDHNL